MTDPLDALRIPFHPVDPDPGFAATLRARMERALLAPEGAIMTVTTERPVPASAARVHSVTARLNVVDVRATLAFYEAAFGAARRGEPLVMPDGRVGHAEVVIGDSVLMLADEYPEFGLVATRGGREIGQSLHLEVADPDAVVAAAVAAGATLERPVEDAPYGRNGVVRDPDGNRWQVLGVPPGHRVGDLAYASLWVPDPTAAERFYTAVLGAPPLPPARGRAHVGLLPCYAVPDVDEAAELVRLSGGGADVPRDEEHGRVADCTDDQGLPFALWTGQAAPRIPDSLVHLVLRVPQAGRARGFYGAVLGWTFSPARTPGGWNARSGSGEPRPRTSVLGGRPEAAAVPSFAVADLDATVAAVRGAGGTASAPAQRPFGRAAECVDDQGLAFQLVER